MNRPSLILLATFLTTLHIHPMDTPMDIEKNESPQQRICYFTMLDPHIWPLIAQYLTFDIESEEEFIARTKATIKKKNTFRNIIQHLTPWEWGKGLNPLIYGYCPNEMNIALLDENKENTLKIIHTKNNQVIHAQELEKKEYQYIALSRNATMFATIHAEEYFDDEIINDKLVITITKIPSQKIQQFDLSDSFKCFFIAFNKQGTHIILHGTDYTQTRNIHLIFPVTVNQPHALISPKKTLEHYFLQKGVCKNIK